jgi:hypothetical protein
MPEVMFHPIADDVIGERRPRRPVLGAKGTAQREDRN